MALEEAVVKRIRTAIAMIPAKASTPTNAPAREIPTKNAISAAVRARLTVTGLRTRS
ncbi:MAG: hypothetical protein ACR2K6_04630 [Solirubrobacterales bacterium]